MIDAELEALGQISSEPAPVVTRVVFTTADLRARAFVKNLFEGADLEIREDPVGNTFARWTGTDPQLPPVATGSHIDAIPNAGRFDGTAGVLGALEAIRILKRRGFQPRRSIELILFTSEEPTRFGVGCLGSRLISGVLDTSSAGKLCDREGKSLDSARNDAGFIGSLSSVRLQSNCYSAFVELHIEQGPLLEQHGNDIGVVTAIAAPASIRLTIQGEGGHAGAVLMPDRRDAFLGAAEIALRVERAACATGSRDTVGTTGVCRVFPGAINSIPSEVQLEIDVRDIDGIRRDSVLRSIQTAVAEICSRRRLNYTLDLLNADPPAQCDAAVVDTLIQACKANHVRWERMISRAYHDSLFMSRIVPTAMLFIPCCGGISHRPDEYASPEAIARGVAVLSTSLELLSSAI